MKVLVVEDSERLSRSLKVGLSKAGFTVDAAQDGRDGLDMAETYDYDAIVLDMMLPGMPGLDILSRLRQGGSNAHVLILSARDRVEDRIAGLDAGADDYLIKPFSFDELCARLQALVRRNYGAKNPVLTVGPLEIDTANRLVTRRGSAIHLTPSEYALLEYLAYHAGRVVTQAQLAERLYRSDADVSSNVIEVIVSGLRKKIHADGELPIIKTRRGFGYYVE